MTNDQLKQLEELAKPLVKFLKEIDNSGYIHILVETEFVKVVQEIAGTSCVCD